MFGQVRGGAGVEAKFGVGGILELGVEAYRAAAGFAVGIDEGDSRPVGLGEVLLGRLTHHETIARGNHEPFGFELAQRLADRSAAYIEVGRQGITAQPIPRCQLALENLALELRQDRLVGAGRLDRLGRRRGGLLDHDAQYAGPIS